jgi:hypothetical protein
LDALDIAPGSIQQLDRSKDARADGNSTASRRMFENPVAASCRPAPSPLVGNPDAIVGVGATRILCAVVLDVGAA